MPGPGTAVGHPEDTGTRSSLLSPPQGSPGEEEEEEEGRWELAGAAGTSLLLPELR